jgi:hypothetical protein
MLLLHQAGSLKIGEVVRYTVTYTPASDRILPSPSQLHLKIKNTSAIALRAAFVHGPYTIYAAAYPATFNPNSKFENPRTLGVPEFEPNLKAGGSFSTDLYVPEDVRQTAGTGRRDGRSPGGKNGDIKSVSWIIEVASQVIFSTSAAVHYEILLGRDEKSLSMGFGLSGNVALVPGQLSDHQQSQGAKDGHHSAQPKGIYSKAISITVDDTASLWNTPRMPEWDDAGKERAARNTKDAPVENAIGNESQEEQDRRPKRQKKVHLVVLTHGLHSNLGADMLFLKESIDATAKKARIDARARKAKERQDRASSRPKLSVKQDDLVDRHERNNGYQTKHSSNEAKAEDVQDDADADDDDEEEVIVRGFSGNAVRTEKGIKYLGKRLAKYVLQMTYPDQPYRPISKKSTTESLSHAIKPEQPKPKHHGVPSHNHSTIEKEPCHDTGLPYKITSISFIAHSLGGLVQTYAVAYIQKHSPEFFDIIEPINFIAMASPFLGLSNENPMYVKFALDFGLVGRTGQDLGLTWRAPTIARSGWGALVSSLGESAHKKIDGETAPEAKPLLRILPTGPAHTVLKKFRNRTVYSNVVNDGIVPLRTSCLLFLDWSGLGRVEKARRESGLVGTIAEWGWAEVTGQNTSSPMRRTFSNASLIDDNEVKAPTRQGNGEDVPQPAPDAADDDDLKNITHEDPHLTNPSPGQSNNPPHVTTTTNTTNPLAGLMSLFRPNVTQKPQNSHPKHTKMYQRSQTLKVEENSSNPSISTQDSSPTGQSKATSGDSDREDFDRLSAPPKTSFFESAGDLLKPPIPPVDFFINPASRPRTIFHDRVYHPGDIPPPPLKKRSTPSLLIRRRSSSAITDTSSSKKTPPHTDSNLSAQDYDDTKNTNPDKDPLEVVDGSAMRVEEKIARAYHRDLSWRKVLVRLEPDAHNNMIVRRMFANAYGWPVIHHLCETHFSDSVAALTRDEDEGNQERAKSTLQKPDSDGGEVNAAEDDLIKPMKSSDRTDSEVREATDAVPALTPAPRPGSLGLTLAGKGINIRRPTFDRAATGTDSEAGWSERDWADSEADSDDEGSQSGKGTSEEVKKSGWNWTDAITGKKETSPKGTEQSVLDEFLGKKKEGEVGGDGEDSKHDSAAVPKLSTGEISGVGVGLEDSLTQDDTIGAENEQRK